ncbi:MAG: glycosyltransferase [Actinomycetota bacterium]
MADGVGGSPGDGVTTPSSVPALFVVGPQRTGTSWIYEYLAAQPGVYLDRSRKENYFFDRSRPATPTGDRRRLLSRFEGSGPARLLADVNPIYLGRRPALERLLAAFPEARLVVIDRDDTDRRRSYRLHQDFNRASSRALGLLGADNLYVSEGDRLAQQDFEANVTELSALLGSTAADGRLGSDAPDGSGPRPRLLRLAYDDLATDGGTTWVEQLARFVDVDLAVPNLGTVYATRTSRGPASRLAAVPVRAAQAAGLQRPVNRRRQRQAARAVGAELRPLTETRPDTLVRPTAGGHRRVLLVITLAAIGGAQNHVLDLAEELAVDHEVTLAVGEDGPLVAAVRRLGHRVEVLPELGRAIDPFRDGKAVAALGRLIDDVRPDLVHAHSSKAGLVARLAARRRSIPCLFTAHGWVFAPNVPAATRSAVWASELAGARLGTGVICVSERDAGLARRWLGLAADRTWVVPYGITAEGPMATPADEPVRILMPARFQQQKDHRTLLQAIANLDDLDFEVHLAGDGPLRPEMEELAQSLDVAGKVVFLGDRTDVAELLARSQICVLSTNYEGLPISILEAMRARLPVVATDVGGVAEEVVDGVTGRVVAHADPVGLAAALGELIADPGRRERMGRAGRARFDEHFRRDLMMRRIRRVYRWAVGDATHVIDLREPAPGPVAATPSPVGSDSTSPMSPVA